ncbi:hypothetical protein DFQ28_006010 [Apophysomyces sp. BC1034]|nr:hypothetical protein DFQ30_000098 [Apophysomyces sp. BC1015]KAG0182419.1 hypothetical protein DFQ29_004222 [Apophysomyces sp. BC1021]KAG0193229.1 hypothetical protein DFQ28_006010 [Apophysomyces sp. BC1034]
MQPRQGHDQAQKTGAYIVDLMNERHITVDKATIVIYTSPFQRCIDTAIGLARGMATQTQVPVQPPVIRLQLGLGEWMCERFFDEVCPASHLLDRQQEALARQQALTYAARANNNKTILDAHGKNLVLPPLSIDHGYRSVRTEFDFPERYTDMLQRFDQVREECVSHAAEGLPKDCRNNGPVVTILVTHAVGVNALLDSFRNRITRPVETSYCSVSCVQWKKMPANLDTSDQSEEEEIEPLELSVGGSKPRWCVELEVSDIHLKRTP